MDKKQLKLQEKYCKVFEDIIERHLEDRINYAVDDQLRLADGGFIPSYALQMCMDIWRVIHEVRGDTDNHLDTIVRLDRYNQGCVDYVRKFALHCANICLEKL
jgi:hypothetical protein